ncbi:uncharacterized protein [Haliotis cracherodii]|uniref:uncharacterized protein n=1 Tax=Haliotis cracherodii TaxID=6455 RepID=UPI0039E7A462
MADPVSPLSMTLPLTLTLPDGGDVTIDQLTDAHMTEMYAMIVDAAQHGEGYGMDEYLNEEGFRSELGTGQKLAIMRRDTGELIAGVGNSIGHTCRTQVVVEAFLVVKRSERGRKLGYLILHLSILLARDYGYFGLLLNIVRNNTVMQKLSDYFGFTRVGELPVSCLLPSGQFEGGLLYYLDVRKLDALKNLIQKKDGKYVFVIS